MADQVRDLLAPEAVLPGLKTRRFGRRLLYYPAVGSTMDLALEAGARGAPEGTVIVAEEQSAGRGRLGRSWVAPACCCLLISLLFRPRLEPQYTFRLTMLGAVAAARAIEAITGLRPALKWPNDLLLSGKKVGGLLGEARLKEDRLDFAVLGLGLNVNFDPRPVPELAEVTSLMVELGAMASRVALLQAFLEEIELLYPHLLPAPADWLYREWRRRLATLGQRVRITAGEERYEGLAEEVAPNGALLLRREDGKLMSLLAGDVTTLR